MARIFIVDGTQYPDPGPDVSPEQFKELMQGFLPELANADMKTDNIMSQLEIELIEYYQMKKLYLVPG